MIRSTFLGKIKDRTFSVLAETLWLLWWITSYGSKFPIIVFPAVSDINCWGVEIKFISFEVRWTGLATYFHHFLAV